MSDQRTALVLGGGGITGIAWEIGVLAGLAEAGVDLSGADLVVGTSAGSVVGRAAGLRRRARGDVRSGSWSRATAEKAARLNRGHPGAVRLGDAAQPREGRRVPPADRRAGAGRGEGRPDADRAGAARRHRLAAGQHRVAGAPAGDHRRRRGDRRVPHVRPRLRRPAAAGGRGQLRGARGLPAGHHRRTPLRRRRHALGRERRPRHRTTTGSSSSRRSRAGSGRWPASTRR